MCSSTSAPMAEVISIILVRANMITTSLMIQITLRIVLYLCLFNHCGPTCYTDVSRSYLSEANPKLYLCECHCLIPYALIIYYVSSYVNRVGHLLLKITEIVISPYCVRVYVNGARPHRPKSFGSIGLWPHIPVISCCLPYTTPYHYHNHSPYNHKGNKVPIHFNFNILSS